MKLVYSTLCIRSNRLYYFSTVRNDEYKDGEHGDLVNFNTYKVVEKVRICSNAIRKVIFSVSQNILEGTSSQFYSNVE